MRSETIDPDCDYRNVRQAIRADLLDLPSGPLPTITAKHSSGVAVLYIEGISGG
jgi:hypothetical protein